jgi:hypothetical protein
MRIPRYWAKEEAEGFDASGKAVMISAWGWSSTSLNEAREVAGKRAKIGLCRLTMGPVGRRSRQTVEGLEQSADDYDQYLSNPMREEIIETLKHDGETTGIITRNRYGALVLNSANVLFVDIDRSIPHSPGLVRGLKSVFSKTERETPILESHAEVIIRVVAWWYENRSYSFRLYATRAGLRLLFTDKLYEPDSTEVKRIFNELGSDELYQRLTTRQKTFRARLTPKPWRIGMLRPPHRFPYASSGSGPSAFENDPSLSAQHAIEEMDDWITLYDDTSLGFHVCTLLEEFGGNSAHPIIDQIVARHDKASCGDSGKPLA